MTTTILIDPLATNSRQWLQKQSLLTELNYYANRPIDQSLEGNLQLRKKFERYIFEQSFDALLGGVLVKGKKKGLEDPIYSKPVLTNIYVAKLLLAADQVFYSGEFSLRAQQMVSLFTKWIRESNAGLVRTTEYFLVHDLACAFDRGEIKRRLDTDEVLLLDALTLYDKDKQQRYHLVCYHQTLKSASHQIGMHYKQAQIVENSIHIKLKQQPSAGKATVVKHIDDLVLINCQLLTTFCHSQLFSKESDLISIAQELFSKILGVLEHSNFEHKPFRLPDLLDTIYAGLVLLQLDFDKIVFSKTFSLVTKVNQGILRFDLPLNVSLKQHYQIDFINNFIKQFATTYGQDLGEIRLSSEGDSNGNSENFEFLFLDKNSINLNEIVTEANARYDHKRMIYLVDYQTLSILF